MKMTTVGLLGLCLRYRVLGDWGSFKSNLMRLPTSLMSFFIGSRRIEYRRLSPGIIQFWTIAVVSRLDKTVEVWDQSVS